MDKPTGKREALRIARALREKFRNGGEFTTTEYRESLALELEDLRDDAFDSFVDSISEKVDREEGSLGRDTNQRSLFDMDGEYRLGDTRRIAKRLAHIEHADAAMAIKQRNAAAVMESLARDLEELGRLRPYWGPGVTKEQAIAAYKSDHDENQN